MSTSFPAALDNFTNPSPTSPRSDHAAQHANANDAIEAIQALLGITGSSDPASITKRVVDLMAVQATQPKTLWASGHFFFIPPGDGGATGLLFSGGGTGAFTLSAAIVSGLTLPKCWIYLTANAGGSGNPAGWHYATMSDDTHGIVYANRYDSTSGVAPVFPASPTTLNCTSATRLAQTTNEVQTFQVAVNYSTQMGINGNIEASFVHFATVGASTKYLSIRAGTNLLYQSQPASSPSADYVASIQACGSLSNQVTSRINSSVGGAASAILGSALKSINLAAESTLNFGMKLSANTDGLACVVRGVTMNYSG